MGLPAEPLTMPDLPAHLDEGLSYEEHPAVDAWWAGLSDAVRAELAALLDPRADSCSFTLEGNEQGLWIWRPLPLKVDSESYVDTEEPDADWNGDYFEYRLVNPERWPLPPYEFQAFHIGGLWVSRLVPMWVNSFVLYPS
jgi:hypothetical protein